ncbi:carbamoyltransferase [Candidatus Magnetomorum sp. HK-1]|nr:carbamoyltransferase [Candidatus Magnetomorum sp. HK-1]
MIILGINESHGASACLSIDGKIVSAVMEERFTRLKNDEGYPYKSIEYCLKENGIKSEQINYIALSSESLDPLSIITRRMSYFSVDDWIKEQKEYWKPKLLKGKHPDYYKIFSYKIDKEKHPWYYDFSEFENQNDWSDPNIFLTIRKKLICKHLGVKEDIIKVVKHYTSHSYYGFYGSQIPRKPTLIFHAESGGDGMNASIMKFENINKGLEYIYLTDKCFLGRIYKYVTLLLGFLPGQHEYKIMGLAPYAREKYIQRSLKVFKETLQVNNIDFLLSEKLSDCFWYFEEHLRGHRFDDIAGALQRFVEELIVNWVKNAVKETGIRQVVFSGGVSMNVKINKLLWELEEIDNFFVPPSGADESLCIGATYKVLEDAYKKGQIKNFNDIEPIKTTYLGPSFDDKNVRDAIEKKNIKNQYQIIDNPSPKQIAELLAKGKVIARLKGRMEFGARALGNRSILANPSFPKIVKKINEQIKSRDFWMPFCPVIKADREKDYILNPKNIKAPFMTIAFDTVKNKQNSIFGALHPSDLTARPQVLKKEYNPEYFEIISEFEKITGIGVLLNTSLNLHGVPIDCTPEDGLSTFLNSSLDGILLNNSLILR